MPTQRHIPFAVFRQSMGGVGDAGAKKYDIVNGDSSQSGLGVPAKSIVIINHGPGILFYQISSNIEDVSVVDGIDSGQGKAYATDEGVYTATIQLYSDNAATIFSMVASPGIWTDDEIAELYGG